MEMVIFIGAPAAGKSSFYRVRFFDTHVRINLDMLRTRHRERILIQACLQARQPVVIDNTNPTQERRKQYVSLAKQHGFTVVGYYFQSVAVDCLARNRSRDRGPLPSVPDVAIRGTIARLERPSFGEGFDTLNFVRIVKGENDAYAVEEWNDEV